MPPELVALEELVAPFEGLVKNPSTIVLLLLGLMLKVGRIGRLVAGVVKRQDDQEERITYLEYQKGVRRPRPRESTS